MKTHITEDNAVSEIIGALLLFAIVSVLLTSFILWYVPSTSTNNEITFQMETQNSMASLEAKMLNQNLKPGDSVSENVPLGISGTPPFIPAESTNIYYSSNFNASMSYSLEINYTKQIHRRIESVVSCANTSSKNIMNNIEVSEIDHYELNFIENGLKTGRYWSVQVDGLSKSSSPVTASTSTILSFCLPMGEYTFRVSSDSKSFKPNPARGIVFVNTSSVSIPVSFTCNVNQTVISGNFGEESNLDSVNFNRISPYYENYTNRSGSYERTKCVRNWLGDSSNMLKIGNTNYYRLASQQFTVSSSYESVNYVEFMLEPNLEYGNQFMQGNSSLYINIGKTAWGSAVTGSSKIINLNRDTNSTSYSKNDILEKVNFDNCILLGTQHPYVRTYYLNFWESVNESSGKSFKQNNNFDIRYSNAKVGFGYGPNEFLAPAHNEPCYDGVGNAYDFAAEIECNVSSFKDNNSLFHEYNCFNITKDNMKSFLEPYYFLIGYNPSCGSSSLHITEKGIDFKSNSTPDWKICVGENAYEINGTSLTLHSLCDFQYSLYIPDHGKFVPDIVNGVISIHNGCNSLSITFINSSNQIKDSSDISDQGIQCISLTNIEKFNCISMYFFNLTNDKEPSIPDGSSPYVKVSLYNNGKGNALFMVSRIIKINGTGYYNLKFLDKSNLNEAYSLSAGNYYLSVMEVNANGTPSRSNDYGWGFTTSGGFDNYIQEVSQQIDLKSINNSYDSIITPYYASQPCLLKALNQTFIYSIRYVNNQVISDQCQKVLNRNMSESGALISSGSTQFTHSSKFLLGDGLFLTSNSNGGETDAGKLPLSLSFSSNGTSMNTGIYGMKIMDGIPTSESNTGSSYLSMCEMHRNFNNLALMHSFICNNNTYTITGLNLLNYSYTIESHFSEILGKSFYNLFDGVKGTPEKFNVKETFTFVHNKNKETIKNINHDLKLRSFSCTELEFKIDSI